MEARVEARSSGLRVHTPTSVLAVSSGGTASVCRLCPCLVTNMVTGLSAAAKWALNTKLFLWFPHTQHLIQMERFEMSMLYLVATNSELVATSRKRGKRGWLVRGGTHRDTQLLILAWSLGCMVVSQVIIILLYSSMYQILYKNIILNY